MSTWYARRAVAWLPLLACTALGALFGVLALMGSSGWEPLSYALVGLVPAAAFVADEPAAALVDSGTKTLRWRTAARTWALILPAGAFLVLVVWVADRPDAPTALLIAEGWILMADAFAATVVLRRAGHDTPSRVVAPAAVLLLAANLLLAGRLHAAFQPMNVVSYAPWLRLILLALIALALVRLGSRDLAVR